MIKRSILLIDDSAIDNLINEKIIHHYNIAHNILRVNNGEEAIALLKEKHANDELLPDAILIDLDMPIMNGFQFIEAYRALDLPGRELTQLIIFSSSSASQDLKRAEELGIKHYFTKPLDADKLIEALKGK